jgi:GNAT superfamily N-acetyltransferase
MDQEATAGLEITRATAADWPVFESWAAAEGWNPGPADGGCFLAQDPDGWFLGRIDGTPVSAISLVNYGETFSFLGFYLVHPEYRGRGLGYATWQAGLRHAGDRVIGLDGVVAQQENYRKSGFTLAHRNIRYVGEVAAGTPASAPPAVRPAAEVEFAAIEAYDSAFFPAERPVFLRHWLAAPGHIALAAVADGEVVGYGAIRPAPAFAKVGPLFADTPEVAEALFQALVDALAAAGGDGEPVQVALDVPEPTPAAVALAERHGMKPSFETARMYTGPVREIDLARVYGITSFELG